MSVLLNLSPTTFPTTAPDILVSVVVDARRLGRDDINAFSPGGGKEVTLISVWAMKPGFRRTGIPRTGIPRAGIKRVFEGAKV